MAAKKSYLRVLEVFLNYEKVNGEHLVRYSDFIEEMNVILIGDSDYEEILMEMYALDLIIYADCEHLLGENGILLLEKGKELLYNHRNMKLD